MWRVDHDTIASKISGTPRFLADLNKSQKSECYKGNCYGCRSTANLSANRSTDTRYHCCLRQLAYFA